MQRGVEQHKKQYIPNAAAGFYRKTPARSPRHDKDYQPRHKKSDAGKEHLAAGLVGGDVKRFEAEFDERISPTPQYGCRECKSHHPTGALEDTYCRFRFIHWLYSTSI